MSAAFEILWTQSVQIALVFVIVCALDVLVARRGSVGLRTALWAAFFAKLVVPPTLTSPVSIARALEFAPGAPAAPAGTESAPASLLPAVLLSAWALVSAATCGIALRRMRRSRAEWTEGAQAAPAWADELIERLAPRVGLKRAPRLLVRERVAGAASVGLWSPVVVVPARLLESRLALEHVLLHELAHVRRRDALRAAAWTLARCVYWFHPLVHAAARRAALVRELACDHVAAATTASGAESYRRTLLELARPLAAAPALTGFGGSGPMILARLDRLERPLRTARRFDVLPGLAFAVLCLCCVPLGSQRVEPAHLPQISEVDGCMQKRLLVMAELAKRQQLAGAAALD